MSAFTAVRRPQYSPRLWISWGSARMMGSPSGIRQLNAPDGMWRPPAPGRRRLRLTLFLAAVCAMLHVAAGSVLAEVTVNGYYYHVQPRDTWFSIAKATGHSVETLQGLNPQAVRDFDIVYRGEKLLIPADFSLRAARYHYVQTGESWNSLANLYEINLPLLLAANNASGDEPPSLTPGRSLFIPPLPTELGDSGPQLPPTLPEGMLVPAAYQAHLPFVTTFAQPLPIDQQLADVLPNAGGSAPLCPEAELQIVGFLQDSLAYWLDDPRGVVQSADECAIQVDAMISDLDINGDGFIDLLLAYGLVTPSNTRPRTGLVLFQWRDEAFDLEMQIRASGDLSLLAVGDVNGDDRSDLVYADESCGASVCYTTVHIESWDPDAGSWGSWAAGPIAMVNAEVKLREAGELGSGLAISVQGGVHEDISAGPQRARTEIWASPDGTPFTRVTQEYGPTSYLYHVVMEAHQKTLQSPAQNLYDAQILYRQALADHALTVWHDASERDYLRSFSLLRLAIIAAYQDQPEVAAEIVSVLNNAYPSSVFSSLGRTWHQAYAGAHDLVVACTAANAYAAAHAATWQPFGSFGYANPPLAASDICPILADFSRSDSAPQAEAAPVPLESLFPSAEKLRNMDPQTFAASADLPACPGSLDGYPKMIETLLNGLKGDLLLVETWTRLCEVVTDEAGALESADLNGDGLTDVVALVAGPESNGIGPDGVGSRLMVYYQSLGKSYNLIFLPPSLGLSSLLALDDINGDGRQDLVWVDTVCNFLCLSTVEVLSWDGDYVNSHIRKGSTVANGTVRIAPSPPSNPGQGQQIILRGGISGLIPEELQVEHVELWESIEGGPYQRVWYEYDPQNPASRCLGLNLVEADVVLEGASAYGYGPARQLYRNILDDSSLQPCSVTGTPSELETELLRGLAFFRLVQVNGLMGDMRAALQVQKEMEGSLTEDNPYLEIAGDWRQAYAAASHPVTACQTVLPLIQKTPATWQVTDVFGMDHPSETESTLCFVPPLET